MRTISPHSRAVYPAANKRAGRKRASQGPDKLAQFGRLWRGYFLLRDPLLALITSR